MAADRISVSNRSQASGANSSLREAVGFLGEGLAISASHSFIVYIDEAGDDGIKNFRTTEDGGSSQWLNIAGCVVSADNDPKMPKWRDGIVDAFRSKQKRDLHFKHLNHEQRLHTSAAIAALPVRLSVIMSNKTTIPTHSRDDLFAAKNTLYWYLCRYLVERVSVWCARRAERHEVAGNGTAKLIFSRRGGLDYDNFRDYLRKLKDNHATDPTRIVWTAIDIEAVEARDHMTCAGLQIADIPASAFLRAVSFDQYGNVEPHYAKLLCDRMMANEEGVIIGTGVKPVPRLDQMTITPAQREVFDFYIKARRKWAGP